jgi:phage/conjugal plasmid C-4 type zinc finger TraR family protein
MSGYGGNPDAEAEHALILQENGIAAARAMLPTGESATHCRDCGEPVPEARRQAMKGCQYCIVCQPAHDHQPRVKMLDRIL